jgi:hypothetical protein
LSDILERLRDMPSSLNDACRRMDEACNEIARLRHALEAQPTPPQGTSGERLYTLKEATTALEQAIKALSRPQRGEESAPADLGSHNSGESEPAVTPAYAGADTARSSPDSDPLKTICKVLCESGIFETGQGTCACACMDQLGNPRKKGCYHAERIHDKLAHSILEALSEYAGMNARYKALYEAESAEVQRLNALHAPAQSAEPVCWQYRFHPGAWTNWVIVTEPIDDFRRRQRLGLEKGTVELRPLYAGKAS